MEFEKLGQKPAAEKQLIFPRRERLKGRDEIQKVFKQEPPPGEQASFRKKVASCPGAKLFILKNGLSHNRIAFTFSRKFGNAVERNHARRLGREAYRHLRQDLKNGFDLVLLLYPEDDGFKVRMEQLRELCSRSGLFRLSSKTGR